MKTSALLIAAPITFSAPDRHNRSADRRDIGNVFISLGLAKGEQLGEMAINGSGQGKDQSK